MTDKYDAIARDLVKEVQTNLMLRQEGSVPAIAEALRQAAADEREACLKIISQECEGDLDYALHRISKRGEQ